MALTIHSHLERGKKKRVELLHLWAFVVCSRVTFTFTFTYYFCSALDTQYCKTHGCTLSKNLGAISKFEAAEG